MSRERFCPKLKVHCKKKIAPLGATDNRQVCRAKLGMPAKKCFKTNQSAEGATENTSVVPSALFISLCSRIQGFRASHSTACLETVVPDGTFFVNGKLCPYGARTCRRYKFKSQQPQFLVQSCVRDWSGILCEHFRTTDNGQQTTVIFERGGNKKRAKIQRKARRVANAQNN